MATRRTIIPTVILAAFIVLSLPAMAAAQRLRRAVVQSSDGEPRGQAEHDLVAARVQ